jgi:hypothetical protein
MEVAGQTISTARVNGQHVGNAQELQLIQSIWSPGNIHRKGQMMLKTGAGTDVGHVKSLDFIFGTREL